ncbi:acetyl/propionyl/methylcrotonyl-CoA carboxylase subunit alpha [Streptomyces sp. NPDC060194]|uniref:acetyl/propionyl/methylcrotonyl-CoA carboxylase subunit alpha n=1 Tax=Streptomyces sp. NPDC060194 TaxID=3347069 RepID=UPI00364C61D3
MITTLLVANRGEIAVRIFRTCRELGVSTVAVYSDPDADALHVRTADTAVRLPGAAPADTYLRADLVVKAALAAGADAVHPGYGFLSENAAFARAVTDAGLTWVGPPAEAIEAMASKTGAKALMGAAGVPLLAPLEEVTAADLPVIVKAVAGGGGRGMRVVRDLAALPAELESAGDEALAAFGDATTFVEPYLEGGRHVEVQVLADDHGTVWALGTRDCSLQRRHQKVVEEAPAPGLSDALRAELGTAAGDAARAIGYRGAGTLEFMVAGGRAYFLEMNTRLQVEHPVTEAVFGVDLVAEQLRVAEGAALAPSPPEPRGHAVEVRLYAEDPARGWAPQAGKLHRFEVGADGSPGRGAKDQRIPAWPAFEAAGRSPVPAAEPRSPASRPPEAPSGVRLDTGFAGGDTVGIHYDPLLAKLIAYGPDRPRALRLLITALENARVHGPATNRDLLLRSLRHPEFAEARMDTGFYDRHLAALTEPAPADPYTPLAAALAAAHRPGPATRFGRPGWRNLPSQPAVRRYRDGTDGTEHEVRYRLTRDGLDAPDHPGVRLLHADPARVVLETDDGIRRTYEVATYADDPARVHVNGTTLTVLPRFPDPTEGARPGTLLAPMPGTVVRIAAEATVGAHVTAGRPLLWLEAMKMEHRIDAPGDGTLTALHVTTGDQVDPGTLLAVVTPAEDDPPTDTEPPAPTAQEDRS